MKKMPNTTPEDCKRVSPAIDPASLYRVPQALALDGGLTRSERICLLRGWQHAEKAEDVATTEGMPPGSRSRLGEITQALAVLEEAEAATAARRDELDSPAEPDAEPAEYLPVVASPRGRRRNPLLLVLLVLACVALAALLVSLTGAWGAVVIAVIVLGGLATLKVAALWRNA